MNSNLYQSCKVDDNDNILLILYNEILFLFDGHKWSCIYISDINLPDTDFKHLKKPSLVEISNNQYMKTILVTGGFIPTDKSFAKTVYTLNFRKSVDPKEKTTSYDCLLDFKYGDMKVNRFLHNSININGEYVIIIGGKNDKGCIDSCEYINLKTGEWKNFTSMIVPRSNFDCILNSKNNTQTIYVYGGYSGAGKFSEPLIEFCQIDCNNLDKSQWKQLNIKDNMKFTLPKICSRIINYDDNILIIGGSDGKHLISDIYELDTNDMEIHRIGKLRTARNNFHCLFRENDIFLVGGSCKKFTYCDEFIDNYVEKFTFNLANQIETNNIPVLTDILLTPIRNLSINESEFISEAGFPYYSSIISKEFN